MLIQQFFALIGEKIMWKKLLNLYWIFLKMGAVCFGGGYAMLPILERELVLKRGWVTKEEIIDYYALGQCTPGVIAVNTSTFVGNKLAGNFGGIIATLGFITPSIVIITIIGTLLENFAHIEIVQNAFSGIRICVCVLIINATVNLWKTAITDKFGLVMFVIVLVFSSFLNISPIFFVLGSGFLGFLFKTLGGKKKC